MKARDHEASWRVWTDMRSYDYIPCQHISRECIRPNFNAAAIATAAPSPSETNPIRSGRAPIPPDPIMPKVGHPALVFPLGGMTADKSV